MARRRKGLSEEDLALWKTVTQSISAHDRAQMAKPAAPTPVTPAPAPAPAPLPLGAPQGPQRVVKPELRRLGPSVQIHHAPSVIDGLDPARGLDKRTAQRVKRGKRVPEARIDLHGMTAERAHRALDIFIRSCHGQGMRFVLVITGKGGRRRDPDDAGFIPEGAGVLRHAVPRWLREAPVNRMVTGVYPAHLTHGGEGAVYVQLSKRR